MQIFSFLAQLHHSDTDRFIFAQNLGQTQLLFLPKPTNDQNPILYPSPFIQTSLFFTSMAALCVNHPNFRYKNGCSSLQRRETRSRNRPRTLVVSSSHNNDESLERSTSNSKTKKKDKEKRQLLLLFGRVLGSVQKLGIGLKEKMSPQRKGDWKDVMLMSLSFAVYVYMSQKLVCAYCAWMSMLKQSW